MPTSYPLNLPATPGFQQIKMQQVTQVSMSQSPFSGVQQVQEWPAEWWQAEVSLPPMTRANAAAWTAFFAQCRGRSGTILAGDSGAKISRGAVARLAVNLLQWSEVFDNAVWTINNALTVTPNQVADPNGFTTADLLTSGNTTSSNISQVAGPLAAGQYIVSVWVRAGTASSVTLGVLSVPGFTILAATAQIISGPGAVSGSSFISVTGLTTAWTRVALTVTATAGQSIGPAIYPKDTTANTLNIYAWGAQVEAGASASAYIGSTSGALVTNGANQSGRILYLRGAAPNSLMFAAGDYVQVGAGAGATRITTTGGTSTVKYFADFGVSVPGQPYISSARLFNLGAKSVIVGDNVANQATVAPGVRTGVQLVSTGDGTAHLQMLFFSGVVSDSLDFIIFAPRVQKQGIDENFIAPAGLNFTSGWNTFSGSSAVLTQNYNQRLYQAVSDSISDGAGNVAIEVFPRLRADAMGNGDPVVYQACKGLFRLQSNLREWDIDEAMLYGISFKLIEAF